MKHKHLLGLCLCLLIILPATPTRPLTAESAPDPHFELQSDAGQTGLVLVTGADRHLLYTAAPGALPDDMLSLAPDNRTLAFVEIVNPTDFVTRLLTADLASGSVTELVPPTATGMPSNPLWSPAGDQLAYIWLSATPPGFELRVIDLATGGETRLLGPGAFSVEVAYGKTYALAWESDGRALQFFHHRDRRVYRTTLSGAREEVADPAAVAPEIAEYMQVMRLGPEAPTYDGMVKPVSVRDYDGTCGNGYSGLYPDYGGCVLTGPHPGVDMYAGATNIGCGTPVVAVCTGPIIRVEKYAYAGDGCQNSTGGGTYNLGWQIVLRCEVPPANWGGVTYGGGMVYSVYAHLRYIEPDLAWGVWVPKGRVLGQVGSTGYSLGAHLHFQTEKDVTGLDSSHPVYPKTYDTIAAYTWNPMYFIQAHMVVSAPASAPSLLAPAGGSSTCDATPSFSWSSVSGATGYRIQVDNSSAFGSPEVNQEVTAPAFTPGANLSPGAYFWRVQAVNAGGNGPWSSTGVVAIIASPAAPVLTAPANGSGTCDTTPTFSWNKVTDATSYLLQVDNNADFSSPEINLTTSGIPYTPGIALPAGTYYWRVRAANTCGSGGWSPVQTVTVAGLPAAPALSAPAHESDTCDATPAFSWSSIPGATSYLIQVDDSASFGSPVISESTAGIAFTPAAALAAGGYYWRVRTANACGISAFSPTRKLTVVSAPKAPQVLVPPDQARLCDATPGFKWTSVAGANGYRIQLDNNFDFSSPAFTQVTTGPAYTPGKKLALGSYYWRAQASNACGYGPWTSSSRVSLIACNQRVYLPRILRGR